jgi:2-C-methyl-D-erythritol 4-phosphate cytidylyltransferase
VVHCVDGEDSNIKITTPFDVVLAELFLSRN